MQELALSLGWRLVVQAVSEARGSRVQQLLDQKDALETARLQGRVRGLEEAIGVVDVMLKGRK